MADPAYPWDSVKMSGRDRRRAQRAATSNDARCARCGKALALLFSFIGRIVIRCPRCRLDNVFRSEPGKPVAQTLDRFTPSELMFAELEARWERALTRRAQERAELAKGLRFDVLNRDGFRCQYCGRSVQDGALLHVDHVVPRSKGGADTLDNLVTACASCNLGKGAKDLAP